MLYVDGTLPIFFSLILFNFLLRSSSNNEFDDLISQFDDVLFSAILIRHIPEVQRKVASFPYM